MYRYYNAWIETYSEEQFKKQRGADLSVRSDSGSDDVSSESEEEESDSESGDETSADESHSGIPSIYYSIYFVYYGMA